MTNDINDSIEVTPKQTREDRYIKSLTRFEKWMLQNFAPLLVLCGGLTAELIGSVLSQFQLPPQETIQAMTRLPNELSPISDVLTFSFGYLVVSALLLLGLFVWLAAAIAWAAFPQARVWLAGITQRCPQRPLPALRFIDLIACIAIFLGVIKIIVALALPYLPANLEERRALDLLIQSIAMLAAIFAGVWLARRRARGKHGANGIWPFWRHSPLNPQRNIWVDIGLGAACYPLSLWLVCAAQYINQCLGRQFHLLPENNPIIGELLTARPNPLALAIILTLATAGAAFFEELIFRGMLYNILRRYLSGAVAAMLGAGLFAAAHRLPTQMLGLFTLGLIMIGLYEYTGRLIASMTFHFINNLIMLLLVLLR